MEIHLSTEELRVLRKKQKQPDLHARLYKKVTVLIMLHQGYSVDLVESALGLDDNTIRRYVNKYLSNRDVEDYLNDGYLSYSGKLTQEQESHLRAIWNSICTRNANLFAIMSRSSLE